MKLHPLSLPLRAVSRAIQTGSMLFGGSLVVGSVTPLTGPVLIFGSVLLGALVGVAYEFVYYRRFDYEVTADTFDIGSGVISRREREIPLRRIQNVDISRGIVQRALSIAVVDVETAGGGETEASLRYVGYDEAKRLQRDLRRGAREERGETGGEASTEDGTTKTPAGENAAEPRHHDEPEELLFALSPRNLVVLGLVAPDLRALLPVLFFAVPTVGISIPDLLAETGAFTVGPRGAALAIVSWVGTAAVTAARYYDFRLTRIGDELRYERGLLSRYDGSIPIEKIQQIDVRENVLMRQVGYASLAIETAGYTPGEGPSGGSEAAIPLAGRARVLELARSIEGFDFEEPDFTRPPRRARRRYAVRYALAFGLLAGVLWIANTFLDVSLLRYWYAPLAAIVLMPVAGHYKWLHRGYDVGSRHVQTRNGFWRRSIAVVPAYRVQTVIQTATPFQRWRSLATVAIDTAGSLSVTDRGARAVDFDASEATELRERVRRGLQASLTARRNPHPTSNPSGNAPLGRVSTNEDRDDSG
ncbi:PH domain-containing protein [Halococcus saccharolyticus]|uniref:Membrane-flanked domain protein n=1 Tax=Halococcus saccharolyticus DSM 5350 TaxID=1227455 RepID=M0MQC3_9EURY|nr:PH domain-containing protein [Halococcus saccharolyticus]EMA47836.1 membrane-flanked domain protein [Halococcus saccharolyticus DSM 5350]